MSPQEWEEWQKATRCPASPKKRKVEQTDIISIAEDSLVQLVEETMTRILRGFVPPTPITGAREDVQRLRVEVEANITKVRIELTQLVNTMMERMQAEAERRCCGLSSIVVSVRLSAIEVKTVYI